MDRGSKKPLDSLGSLTWILGGCVLAVLMIALLVLSAPRKSPRLNATPGMTTGEEVLLHDRLPAKRTPL